MPTRDPGTISQEPSDAVAGTAARSVFLTLALQSQRLRDPAVRVPLAEIDEVHIGRGPRLSVSRSPRGGRRALRIEAPDPWMSAEHACLVRVGGAFVAMDLGSKNGTRHRGTPLGKRRLDSGDWLEVGGSFFVYREAAIDGPDAEGATDPNGLDEVRAEWRADEAPGLLTVQPRFEQDLARLRAVAPRRVPVELRGESGTGKELLARAVHRLSGRTGRFVAVNCAALPPQLVEGELFGAMRGSYTGAVADRPGLLTAAHGGTLFLDEVGDLHIDAQASLLRALQEGEARPLGSTRTASVDLRVVTATHRDLPALARAGQFRQDLRARLAGLQLRLPPLRERREDLGVTLVTLLERLDPGCTARPRVTAATLRALFAYEFPLNIRELEHALSVAVSLAGDAPIRRQHLPEAIAAARSIARSEREAPLEVRAEPVGPDEEPPAEIPLSAEEQERRAELVQRLEEHAGNVAAVARAVGKARMQVHRWIVRFGLRAEDYRRPADRSSE